MPDGKRNGFDRAVESLRKVQGLRQQRAETVHEAIGEVLGWMGARRIRAAVSSDPEAAGDRRLLALLADLEVAAVALDAIPSRGRTLARRRVAWTEVLDLVQRVRTFIDIEHVTRAAGGSSATA